MFPNKELDIHSKCLLATQSHENHDRESLLVDKNLDIDV